MNTPVSNTMVQQMARSSEDAMYVTIDLGLAVALVACGHPIVHTTKNLVDGRYGKRTLSEFHFKRTGPLVDAAREYQDNTLRLPVRGFWETIKKVKSEIYSPEDNS